MSKRKITRATVVRAAGEMVLRAGFELEPKVLRLLQGAARREKSPDGKIALKIILENLRIAREKKLPICQDTGVPVFFVELGRELCPDFELEAAINQGVRQATVKGYLRRSVADPLTRENTGDNTPAIVHLRLAAGNRLKLRVLMKGAGAENKSVVKMLSPADGVEGIKRTVIDAVKIAGGQACPPIFLGLGLGGDLETCAILAKRALARAPGSASPDPDLARLERELLHELNKLGIGPAGFGGKITCLAVAAEKTPGHIASLPVAVNIQCWAHRSAGAVI